ncbi:flagellar assembly protein H, partial [Phormidium sp. CCY1219]|nr:flagellar assembly protein H [Phormidium sp. CCY1219]
RRDIMRESSMYQEILAEGREAGLREGIERGQELGRQEGLQEGRREGRQEGLQEGLQEGIEQVALNLVRSGMSLEQIAGVTGLSVQRVRELGSES